MRSATAGYLLSQTKVSRPALARLLAWSVVEAVPVVFSGWLVSRAVDTGFLAHRTERGLILLALYGVLELVRAFAERQIFPVLAQFVEPMRDGLVTSVVGAAVRNAAAENRSHNGEPDSAVVARLTGHVEVVRNLVSALLRLSRPLLVSIVSALIGLATVAPILLVVVVPGLALAVAVYPLSLRAADRRRRAAVLAEERIAEVTGRIVAGARDVIATGGTARAVAEVQAASDADVRARNSLARLAGLRVAIDTLGGRLPLLALVVLAPVLIAHHALSPGQLLGAITYLTAYLIPAVSTVNGAVSQYSTQLSAVVGRLATTAPPFEAGRRHATPATRGADALAVLSDVGFSYGGAPVPVLQHLDLTVESCDHLVIMGSSGAGKSTLGALLAGVDEPSHGSVTVGGQPARQARLAGLTVLVPQESYLIADTVSANLRYLAPDATPAELHAAVAALGISELITRIGGLQAQLQADELSQGERQLLVLARVFASPARLVVLDEATSHLDHATELRVERAFLHRPGTLVVVAHRLASAPRARRVVLLGGGAAEHGSHAELLLQSPRYAALFTH